MEPYFIIFCLILFIPVDNYIEDLFRKALGTKTVGFNSVVVLLTNLITAAGVLDIYSCNCFHCDQFMIMIIPLNIINTTFLFKKYDSFPLKNTDYTDNKFSLNRERQKAEGLVEIALFFYSTKVGIFPQLRNKKDNSFLF